MNKTLTIEIGTIICVLLCLLWFGWKIALLVILYDGLKMVIPLNEKGDV